MARAYNSRRHPLLRDRPKGQWYPDLVGKVPGYFKTYEAWKKASDLMRQQVKLYNAEGITGRSGVPDGWAGKKSLINEIVTKATNEAADIVADLIEEGRFKPDNREARIAMEECVAIIQAEKHTPEQMPVKLYSVKDRQAAINTVLAFTQRKPVSATVTSDRAEDWLDNLANSQG